MCKCIKVSKNAYYHWLKTKDNFILETPKKKLMGRIKIIFEESRKIYGSFRIQKKLKKEGLTYSGSYIGLLMKELGLKSVLRKKYVVTTDSKEIAFRFFIDVDECLLSSFVILVFRKNYFLPIEKQHLLRHKNLTSLIFLTTQSLFH